MATDKKSFLLYCDFIDTFEDLSDEEAGKLIKHIFRYVNDKNPELQDKLIKLAFNPIKQALKRDLEKYEQIKSRNRENANKRWDAKNATASSGIPESTKNADSDSGNDNVIDINTVLTEIEIGATIQYCVFNLQRDYEKERISELWQAFLINGQDEKYTGRAKKIKHFRNWIKNQPYKNGTHKQASSDSVKDGTGTARIKALKKW